MYADVPMTAAMADRAKWAFTTRRVARQDAVRLVPDVAEAIAGDLLLARVDRIGSHKRVQLAEARPAELYEGDVIVVACGARYAADQFEGLAELDPAGVDLLAGGGVAGRMRERNGRMSAPTRLQPLGLLANADGRILNLDDYRLPSALLGQRPQVVGVVGSSMNSGKTTSAASLVHGLQRAGHAVAALKATGTGAFGDFNAYRDAGAHWVADFTDVGMASTYLEPLARIEQGARELLAHAAARGCGVAVIEIADGVFQAETAGLLTDPQVRGLFDGFLYTAGESLSAVGGVSWLRKAGIEPVALSGLVSRSPLASREAEMVAGVPVLTRDELLDPAGATALLARTREIAATSGRVGLAA